MDATDYHDDSDGDIPFSLQSTSHDLRQKFDDVSDEEDIISGTPLGPRIRNSSTPSPNAVCESMGTPLNYRNKSNGTGTPLSSRCESTSTPLASICESSGKFTPLYPAHKSSGTPATPIARMPTPNLGSANRLSTKKVRFLIG